MADIEDDYRHGHIGITDDGEIMPLTDIYNDMAGNQQATNYHIAPAHIIDRDLQRICPHCQTAYRSVEQREPDRCPFCWRLI